VSYIAIWGAVQGGGPFLAKSHNLKQAVLFLQAFTGTIALVALMLAAAVAERQQALFEVRRTAAMLRSREASLANAQRIAQLGNWDLNCTAVAATENFQESSEHFTPNSELRWSDELYRLLGFAPGTVKPTPEVFCRRYIQKTENWWRDRTAKLCLSANPIALTTELCWLTAPNALSANSRQLSQGRSPPQCKTLPNATGRPRLCERPPIAIACCVKSPCEFATPSTSKKFSTLLLPKSGNFSRQTALSSVFWTLWGQILLARCTVRLWLSLWVPNAVLFSGGCSLTRITSKI
jgi:MASE1.